MTKTIGLVSIVVPVLNEQSNVITFVESILKQRLSPVELIVVDGGSTDKTKELFFSYKKKLALKQIELIVLDSERGLIRQRKIGIEIAKREIVSSMDVDTVYPPDYLEEARNILRVRRVSGVTGKMVLDNAPWFGHASFVLGDSFKLLCTKLFGKCFTVMANNFVFLKKDMVFDWSNFEGPGIDQIDLIKSINGAGGVVFDKSLPVPVTSGRRHRKGGLFYFLFVTLVWQYWLGYLWAKVFFKSSEWKRVD